MESQPSSANCCQAAVSKPSPLAASDKGLEDAAHGVGVHAFARILDLEVGVGPLQKIIVEHLADGFQKEHEIDLRGDAMALQRLKEAAEKAKIELSQQMETTVNLPFITADQSGPKHLALTLTRAKFEQLVDDLIERTKGNVSQAARLSGISRQNLHHRIKQLGIDAVSWGQRMVEYGAGELLLTSMDRDGTREGFDIRLTRAVCEAVPVPVIASCLGPPAASDTALATPKSQIRPCPPSNRMFAGLMSL